MVGSVLDTQTRGWHFSLSIKHGTFTGKSRGGSNITFWFRYPLPVCLPVQYFFNSFFYTKCKHSDTQQILKHHMSDRRDLGTVKLFSHFVNWSPAVHHHLCIHTDAQKNWVWESFLFHFFVLFCASLRLFELVTFISPFDTARWNNECSKTACLRLTHSPFPSCACLLDCHLQITRLVI